MGMGDILSLIEKAEFEVSEEKAKEMSQKLRKAEFDFNDFLDQMNQIKKMGGMGSILNMMIVFSTPKDSSTSSRISPISTSLCFNISSLALKYDPLDDKGGARQPVDLKSFQEAEDRQGSRRGGG